MNDFQTADELNQDGNTMIRVTKKNASRLKTKGKSYDQAIDCLFKEVDNAKTVMDTNSVLIQQKLDKLLEYFEKRTGYGC